MFTAVAHKNLADAENYFDEHLAQNDYYAAGEIRPGQWIGAGAENLELRNTVTRDQFHALCENQNPNDGERLTQRSQKGRPTSGILRFHLFCAQIGFGAGGDAGRPTID